MAWILTVAILGSTISAMGGFQMERRAPLVRASEGINIQAHTQDEIRDFIDARGIDISHITKRTYSGIFFQEEPVTSSPYKAGRLSDSCEKEALDVLNSIRYIAGLDADVTLKDTYGQQAQAAALVNYANDTLSHYPLRPDGMSDELYELGEQGAAKSNIAWSSWKGSLSWTLVNSWMEDGDAGNISRVGHRRWILYPFMKAVGFGAVTGSRGAYYAMYAHDGVSLSASPSGVCWPAQNMPVEYFGQEFPWSISMGYTVDEAAVKVKLTRRSDGKQWDFSAAQSDGDFYVDNGNYGQKGCIIFRPDGISYQSGDCFDVEITGLADTVSYTVEFFSLSPLPTATPAATPTRRPTATPTRRPAAVPTATPTRRPAVVPTATPSKKKKTVILSIRNKKKRTVRVTLQRQSGASGYEIRYSTRKNMKGAKKKRVTSVRVVIKNLKKKKYFFQARAYYVKNGRKTFSPWSRKKGFRIKK